MRTITSILELSEIINVLSTFTLAVNRVRVPLYHTNEIDRKCEEKKL